MTSQPPESPSPNAKQTTVGNYFVSNYPPFAYWKPEQRNEALDALDRDPDPATRLGQYIHIPFCRRRCHFCYFRVYTGADARRDRVTRYIDAVLREAEQIASRPLVRGRKPHYVYFGGGTPSFLSPEQLTRLVRGLQAILPWDEAEEVTFECEPGTLDEEKLDTLLDLGITRLSLGVENFDDAILQTNGRAHRSAEILRSYEYARKIGFHQINIDLIAGMLNETEDNWRTCIQKAIAIAPDCLTIYQMEIPYNTIIYKQMKERGELVAPVADWETKRAWVSHAYAELEKAGYAVTSATTAVKDPDQYRFLYRDYLWTGADMVSLGVASFGHYQGTHYQNEKDFEDYVSRVEQDDLPVYRALTMTGEETFLREFILQFKLGRVDLTAMQKKFGVDVVHRFGPLLETYREAGHLRIENEHLVLSRDGLLRADFLLREFFLPQHRGERYT